MARFDPAGRTVLLTGAGAGIGLALARRLLAGGVARLLAVGRDAAKLDALTAEGSGRVVPIVADLAQHAAVDALIARVTTETPDLSLMINNAGVQVLIDLPPAEPAALIAAVRSEAAINYDAPVALCIGLLPLLARQPSAAIVNITSGLALAPKASAPGYCATKAALRSFTRSLRDQCRAAAPNVLVIEALPPMVDTAMTAGRGRAKISPDACAAQILAGLAAGRGEVDVGLTRVLRAAMRVSPALGHRIVRDG